MTIRTVLNRQIRRWMIVYSVAGGTFLLSLPLLTLWPPAQVIGIVGLGIAGIVLFYAWFWQVLCPSCSARLFPIAFQGGRFSLDKRLRFCPYC